MPRLGQPAGLDEEVEFVDAAPRELWAKYGPGFLLVRGRAVVAAFSTLDQAYREAIRRFGPERALVAQSQEEGEARLWAWAPRLSELGGTWDPNDTEWVPSHSWRRGKFIGDEIVEFDEPPPTEEELEAAGEVARRSRLTREDVEDLDRKVKKGIGEAHRGGGGRSRR
ncbi:MAG TPA: hypothetical protein VGB42_01215 [Candidatus Thermoplasmatota archaeon]